MTEKREVSVEVDELQSHIAHYLGLAREGVRVRIITQGTAIAELTGPGGSSLPPRRPGALKGRIQMAEDFDDWPEDILASFEASPFPD